MLAGMTTSTPNRARTAGALLAWLAAAAAATVAGSVAVGAIGSGILPPAERPLSADEVTTRLAQARAQATTTAPGTTAPTTTGPGPAAPPATDPSDATELVSSQGGIVIARCAPGIQVVSATPAQGYRLKDVEAEDGGQRVRFESGHTRVEVRLNCVAGRPVATIR